MQQPGANGPPRRMPTRLQTSARRSQRRRASSLTKRRASQWSGPSSSGAPCKWLPRGKGRRSLPVMEEDDPLDDAYRRALAVGFLVRAPRTRGPRKSRDKDRAACRVLLLNVLRHEIGTLPWARALFRSCRVTLMPAPHSNPAAVIDAMMPEPLSDKPRFVALANDAGAFVRVNAIEGQTCASRTVSPMGRIMSIW